jgi:hypothetical protein
MDKKQNSAAVAAQNRTGTFRTFDNEGDGLWINLARLNMPR